MWGSTLANAAIFALVIPLTGIGNLIYAARMRGDALPPEFIGLLAAKITLFAAMALALAMQQWGLSVP